VKKISINLATRPFRNNAIHWISFGTSVAFLIGFTWFNVYQYRVSASEKARWSAEIEERRAMLDGMAADVATMTRDIQHVDLKQFSDRSAFANAIILSRVFSWSTLFDRLEKVLPENVRLRSIRPVFSKKGTEVSVEALAKDHMSLLKFEEALTDSEYFAFVYPLQEIKSKEGAGEINFSLTFGYVPAGKAAAREATPQKQEGEPGDLPAAGALPGGAEAKPLPGTDPNEPGVPPAPEPAPGEGGA
jgi:Tfp pilus assembly protein PilN